MTNTKKPTRRDVDAAKVEGDYFQAGRLSRLGNLGPSYGPHFGMKSDLERARREFADGYAYAAS